MANVVFVLLRIDVSVEDRRSELETDLVELVVRHREGLAPEDDRLVDRETDSLQERSIVALPPESKQRRTLRKRLYICLPSCLRCPLPLSASCKVRMQKGKLAVLSPGIISAVSSSPSPPVGTVYSEVMPAMKPMERCERMGSSRSSSSRRGRALAVSCGDALGEPRHGRERTNFESAGESGGELGGDEGELLF